MAGQQVLRWSYWHSKDNWLHVGLFDDALVEQGGPPLLIVRVADIAPIVYKDQPGTKQNAGVAESLKELLQESNYEQWLLRHGVTNACLEHDDCDGRPATCLVRESEALGLYEDEKQLDGYGDPVIEGHTRVNDGTSIGYCFQCQSNDDNSDTWPCDAVRAMKEG